MAAGKKVLWKMVAKEKASGLEMAAGKKAWETHEV